MAPPLELAAAVQAGLRAEGSAPAAQCTGGNVSLGGAQRPRRKGERVSGGFPGAVGTRYYVSCRGTAQWSDSCQGVTPIELVPAWHLAWL